MTFNEVLDDDLDKVFFNKKEFSEDVIHTIDNESETFLALFDIKTEVLFNDEVVDTQPSILVKQEVAEKIKHRSILLIKGIEYQRSHDDEENVDLIRIFLERA